MTRYPLDKSWIKCLTVLEIKNGGDAIKNFLNNFPDDEIGDDVRACKDALNVFYKHNKLIPVGNFRSLAVALDKMFKQRQFQNHDILMGSQLRKRQLHDINSSQDTSAHILVSNDSYLENRILNSDVPIRPHIHTAILAKNYFNDLKFVQKHMNIYREDNTIETQFNYFMARLCGKDKKLIIESAEDVPLAVIMNEMTLEEAEKNYPQLRHHETDRIKEMKEMKRGINHSEDHRIIMARAMWDVLNGNDYEKVLFKDAVNKSFPKFWEKMREVVSVYG